MDINDRRPPRPLPTAEDFEKPLTRTAIKAANQKYLQAGVRGRLGTDQGRAREIIRQATKDRFTARREGLGDFSSLGEYLEFLAQAGEG